MPLPTLPGSPLADVPGTRAPSFYLVTQPPPRPGIILLAAMAAAGAVCAIIFAMGHPGRSGLGFAGPGSASAAGASAGAGDPDDKDDDPNQIDTIVLGDPSEAPVPGRRHGNHVSPVHPTIVIRLPRSGPKTGMIPDSPAGHLLYDWLAAFNQANPSALGMALQSVDPALTTAAQMDLRQQTGGLRLISAKEVQPGVLVFRLEDQTAAGTEVLGTLQVRPASFPAAIESFSLRAVTATRPQSDGLDLPGEASAAPGTH